LTKNKTKIIATVGPSCANAKTLISMINSGVNCFRVNLSHGSQEEKKSYFDLIKSLSDSSNKTRPAILADLAGPKVRVRNLKQPIELISGQVVTIKVDKTLIKNICPLNNSTYIKLQLFKIKFLK
jgi:pyruvate kinase